VFKASTGITKDLTAKLADILKKSVEYANQVDVVRQKSLQDWNRHVSEAKSYRALFIDETSKMIQRIVNSASQGVNTMSNAFEKLSDDIKGTLVNYISSTV
jgi:hypothetical protein